ncbi:MAG: hypothetical protein FWH11_06085 [Micrococcales bacterium]|nr:hypothetical protein [Micrococcales bacterium]
MFERFSTQARAAVVEAQELARAWHTERIGTAHVLAGAVRTSGPQGSVAARALARLGVDAEAVLQAAAQAVRPDALDGDALAHLGIDLDEVRARTDATFGPGALDRAGRVTGRRAAGHIPFDAPAKKMLQIALREAIHAGHKQIDTGHLLLAAVRLDETVAHRVLTGLGLDPAAARAAVVATWSEPGEPPVALATA